MEQHREIKIILDCIFLYIDKAQLGSFTQVTGESYGTGDGSTKTFTYTFKCNFSSKTAMYVSVTDGTETFIDDRNGLMVGNLGGTGTINYATGAVCYFQHCSHQLTGNNLFLLP